MTIVLIILATVLGLAAAISAAGKLRRMPQVMEIMRAVGVKESFIPVLAILELLGALGLVVGIWVPSIGLAAAAGLTLYFLCAVVAHLRVKAPFGDAMPAVGLAVLALVVTLLQMRR